MSYTKQLQQALKDAGLYDGLIDGIIGKKSVDAVNEAIKRSGIKTEKLPDGYVTKNFTMNELTHSNTARARRIDNTPSSEHRQNLIDAAINLWQPVRELLGQPMIISSGYRSHAVNKAVGGSLTSAHSFGFAIDFIAPAFGNSRKIADYLVKQLKAKGIKFDQLILEFPDSSSSWIHLGYKNSRGQQRGQVLTAVKRSGKTVYLSGLH